MRVLAVSGASGGHIFPALAFLESLSRKEKSIECLLVLPKKSIKDNIDIHNYNVRYISITSIKLSLDFKNIVSLLNFFKGAFESLIIILEFKPDRIIGFGSLVCIPMLLFGWIFRIQTAVHEQNVMPGRANIFLAKFLDRICLSFQKSRDYFKQYDYNCTCSNSQKRR